MRIPHGTPELKFIRLWLTACAGCVLLGVLLGVGFHIKYEHNPKVVLPEEYRLIKPTDVLKGSYDCKTNTLTIGFNNAPVNKWHSIVFRFGEEYTGLVIDDSANYYSFVKPYKTDQSIGCMQPIWVSTKDSAQLAIDRYIKFYSK